ncbi:MAG: hypothetical protein ACTSO4_16440 [Promethearchaeota archaeon]
MEVQYGKMFLYGLISAIFYIALPLGLIYALEYFNIMKFSPTFTTIIIIFGIIGVVISMLKHLFPKDTSANKIISFLITIYSGIYLFYIFGGFEPGTKLGTYSINTPQIQVKLGLQLMAWLLLISTGVRGMQYLIEAIELRKKKEYSVRMKKRFRLSRLFKGLGMLLSLIIMGYIISVVISGMNLNISVDDTYTFGWDDNGTPSTSDDALNITMSIDVVNKGIYSVNNVSLDVDIYTITTDNPLVLPENTKLGEVKNMYYPQFAALTATLDQKITVDMDPVYVPGLLTTDAILRLEISLDATYAAIFISLNTSIQTVWNALI